jgi:hypothetical protein
MYIIYGKIISKAGQVLGQAIKSNPSLDQISKPKATFNLRLKRLTKHKIKTSS